MHSAGRWSVKKFDVVRELRRGGKGRRKLGYQSLESRHLLAATLWIDFDAAQGGQAPPGQISTPFASLYAPTSWAASSPAANEFLDLGVEQDGIARLLGDTNADGIWDGDGALNTFDVQVAQAKIVQTVETLFKNLPVTVRSTTSGWDLLQASQNNSTEDTFVLFVGNEYLQTGELRTLGRSYQAPVGENNEWFGFVYAGNVAKKMADGDLLSNETPQDFVWNVSATLAREFGRMLGLGNPGFDNGTSFIAAGQGGKYAVNDPLSSLMSAGGKSRGSSFASIDYANSLLPIDIDVEQYVRNSTTVVRTYADGQNQSAELLASLNTDSTTYRARGLATGYAGESNNEFTTDLLLQSFASPNFVVSAATQGTKGIATPTTIAQSLVSGFNEYASTYVDDLANQLNFAATALPLVNADISQALGLASALPGLLPSLNSAGLTTMAQLRSYLIANGFTVDQFMNDTALGNLATNAPGDFFRVHRTYTLLDVAGALGIRSGGLSGFQYLESVGFTGNIDLLASIGFHVAFGIDTAGFYLIPGLAIEANASATGTTYATVNAGLSAAGSFGANVMATVSLTTAATDGRIRLSALSTDFASHASATLTGRAGLDVSYQTNLAGNAVVVDGNWSWGLAPSGPTMDSLNSGLNTRSLKQSISELVFAGVKKLSDNTTTLTSQSNAVPWVGGALSSNIAQSLSNLLTVDTSNVVLLDALAAKGLTVDLKITPSAFLDALFAGNPIPNDLMTINYSGSANQPLTSVATGAKTVAGMSLTLGGNVTGSTNNAINLSLGFDAASGVYLVEGGTIASSITATGNLSGTATVTGLSAIDVTTALNISGLGAAITLSDGDSSTDERFFLNTTQGLNDALQATLVWNGSVALDNLNVKATLASFAGVSFPRIDLTVGGNYDMATGVGTFNSNPGAMVDSLSKWMFAGVSNLRSNAVALIDVIDDIPLIGESIASSMQSGLQNGFQFTLPASGVTNYLASNGFTIGSVITAQQLFSGNLGSIPLLQLDYSRTLQPASFTKAVSGDLQFGPVALSLSGQATIAATNQFQFSFGIDLANGPYMLEGATVSSTIPLATTLTGFVSVGNLLRVGATATLNATVSAQSVLSDFDATENERFYLLDSLSNDSTSLLQLFTQPQSRLLTGMLNAELALKADNPAAKIPVVGAFLPNNFVWKAIVDYNMATQEGSYQIVEDAAFQTAVNLIANTEQTLINTVLAELDRRNPMPQSL